MRFRLPRPLFWLAVVVIIWLPYALVARGRLIDPDEGFMLIAAQLVLDGRVPYRDFFFQQMPLTPYVTAGWMALTGVSWESGRLLSAVLATLTGVLVVGEVRRLLGSTWWALVAMVLFAFSAMGTGWLATAKTYALSTLLLTASVVVISRARGRLGWLFVAAVCLGATVEARLFLAVPVGGLLLLAMWQNRSPRAWLAVLGGFGLALLPALGFLLMAPDAFLFDNLGYHTSRTTAGFIGAPRQKLAVVAGLLGFDRGDEFVSVFNWQLPLLLLGTLASSVWLLRQKRQLSAPMVAVALVAAVSILPTPSFSQYFVVLLPPAIILVVQGLSAISSNNVRLLGGRYAAIAEVFLLLAYSVAWVAELPRLTMHGRGLAGIPDVTYAAEWQIQNVRMISSLIDQDGGRALAWWPGYFFGGQVRPETGTENEFGLESARLFPGHPGLRGIPTPDELLDRIRRRELSTVVVGGPGLGINDWNPVEEALYASGYVPTAQRGTIVIFRR
jgi:hypothetical protein